MHWYQSFISMQSEVIHLRDSFGLHCFLTIGRFYRLLERFDWNALMRKIHQTLKVYILCTMTLLLTSVSKSALIWTAGKHSTYRHTGAKQSLQRCTVTTKSEHLPTRSKFRVHAPHIQRGADRRPQRRLDHVQTPYSVFHSHIWTVGRDEEEIALRFGVQ